MIETAKKPERAILIGLITQQQDEHQCRDFLDELTLLADTAGAIPVKRFTQKLSSPDPATFLGKGKIAEIASYVKANDIDIAIFDDELSGSKIKNIEAILDCKVIDRTDLILDIFAKRAKTAHAKIQVELAQYQYLLPRLAGLWTHLERQKGGIGLRGPGEREIETDRRVIGKMISVLKSKLIDIDKQKKTQRQNRGKLVRISLVGYTNAGKSTLMNILCKADVFAEDKLFATLDTTVRKMVIGNLPLLLCDTVGFIRKLPHHLIESFKSTLDEVRESDFLLHIVDISHPTFMDQIKVVNETLSELGAAEKPVVLIFNKIDAYIPNEPEEDDLITKKSITIDELKKSWMAKMESDYIFISALKKTNMEELRKVIYERAKAMHILRFPYNDLLF